MHRYIAIVIGLLAFIPFSVFADAQFKIKTLETDDMRVIYFDEANEYVLPHLTRCFMNSMGFHQALFDYVPNEKVTIILRDLNDHGYAGATSLPLNYLILGIEPFEQVYETSPTNERLNWVMSHELLHVLASDQAASSDRFFRRLFFGKVITTPEEPVSAVYSYLTSPRMYAPRWYHEGMAVFMETWMAGGYGRVLGGYDEMVFRTMVADDAYFYDVVGLQSEGTTVDFQVGQVAYLYGTRFISYLAYHYGPDKIIEWLNRTNGSKRSYAAQFKRVYDNELDKEWSRWIGWEHEWQRENLDSLRQYPITPYRALSKRPLGSVSRAYYDKHRGKLYSAVLYPGEIAHIVEVDVNTWERRKIVEIPTPALYFVSSLAYDDSLGMMFYTTDNSHQWRDLNVVNVDTGESRLLMKDIRTGDLAFNRADRSLWGIRHHNGFTRLVRIAAPYDDGLELLKLPYGKDMFDIDVSSDGRYLSASVMDATGRQRLIRMRTGDLIRGESVFETLYEFEDYSPANFVFSPDGEYLYGTTYMTGVSNITRYDFESGKMDWITNSETGFFRPLPVSEDSLIAFRYTAEGFEPVLIGIEPLEDVAAIRFLGQAVFDNYPELSDWMLPPPSAVEVDSLALVPRDYKGFRSVGLQSLYPIVNSYKTRVAWGVRLNLMDPMWLNGFEVSALYTPGDLPDDEKGHVKANYQRWPWTFDGWWNRTDFYDFFGPTKTSRKGYSLGAQYEGILINERPRHLDYKLRLAGYAGLERLPDFQNIAAVYEEFLSAGATWDFHSYRRTIGAVENEKGFGWDVDFLYNYVNPDNATINPDTPTDADLTFDQNNYPRLWTSLAYGFLLPWDHSSIWLRPSVGSAYFKKGNRDEPLANFYFGGFGNNWVDHLEVKRYREYYAFPGIELNALGGNNYGKLMAEWTLPPERFRRLGFRSLYCTWAHLRFFSTAIGTNLDDPSIRRSLVNVGVQIDFKLVIFSTLSSTFSLGYAAAFEEGERHSTEFMISLKLL